MTPAVDVIARIPPVGYLWRCVRISTSNAEVTQMTSQQIRFDDGAAYERMMGGWSRLAGETFLQWLKPLVCSPETRPA